MTYDRHIFYYEIFAIISQGHRRQAYLPPHWNSIVLIQQSSDKNSLSEYFSLLKYSPIFTEYYIFIFDEKNINLIKFTCLSSLIMLLFLHNLVKFMDFNYIYWEWNHIWLN